MFFCSDSCKFDTASNSVEADSVVNKLSQNGINASCRQKENFSVMAGNTEVEFEIFVDDWEADKAKKRRRMAAILSLVFIAAVFIIVIATSL